MLQYFFFLKEIWLLRYRIDTGSPNQSRGHCHEKQDKGKCLVFPGAAAGSAWGLLEVISPAHCAALAGSFRLHTPLLCVPARRGRALCVCGFVPFITMQTIFSCSQGRSGIPALFPGFLLVHEKRRNKEEAVVLGLARPWADGDVTGSAAVSGCAGLVMLCPGMACPSPAPPHKASVGGALSAR